MSADKNDEFIVLFRAGVAAVAATPSCQSADISKLFNLSSERIFLISILSNSLPILIFQKRENLLKRN